MKFGVQYYPSHWPEGEWASDVRRMKEAGVKFVRMGDLSWSAYEPVDGELDFEWMDRAIKLFGDAGIQTILCTCSRTPPPWLYKKHPSLLPVSGTQQTRHSDGRYAVAMAHAEFVHAADRIDSLLIERFAGNDSIAAWQLDNEIGCHSDCYCDRCLTAFRAYLEEKYKTTDALNASWGSHFWAFSIGQFDEVPSPVEHPHIRLEYRRFLSSLNKRFAARLADRIRSLDPGKPITTNFQNLYWDHTDYHDLAEVLDVNGMNHYPARTPELALDFYRGGRGEFWVLEQQTHLQGIDSPAGWMRLWAWMAIAHGASALIYFRWRQCRWGCEQFGDGILPHSGRESRFFREFAKLGKELETLAALIEGTRPCSEIALVYSYESRWAVRAANYAETVDPVREAVEIHKAAQKVCTSVDALDPRGDLTAYRLVIAPRLWMMDEQIANNLKSFVEAGGTLCLTAGSGIVDAYGKCFVDPRPALLSEVAGVWISDFSFSEELDLSVSSSGIEDLDGLEGGLYSDEIHLDGAELIAEHKQGWREGTPAITRNRVGRGQVFYIGLGLKSTSWERLVSWLAAEAGIKNCFEKRDGLSVYERIGARERILFVINWTDEIRSLPVSETWLECLTGAGFSSQIPVSPNDIRVLTRTLG